MAHDHLLEILHLLLRPIARFCLRHGLHVQDLLEATKRALLTEASAHLERSGSEANTSRLSAATGIHRRDVMRIAERGEVHREPQGLVNRVIGQWQHDRRFCRAKGFARELTCGVDDSEFHNLVRAISSDIHAGTILTELERLGIVERNENRVRLCTRVFVPESGTLASYDLLTRDCSNLFDAVFENLDGTINPPHLHGTTDFDNIRRDALPALRQWLYAEGSKFHARARSHLARFDLDISQPRKRVAGGCRVSLTTFSFCSDPAESGGRGERSGMRNEEALP